MFFKKFFKSKEERKKFAHIIAGAIILIHSYDKYETGNESYILFCAAGIVFLTVAYFHSSLEKKFIWIDGVFFFIEGVLSLAISYEFFHAGKKALPILYLFLGLFQIFLSFKRPAKKSVQNKLFH